MSILSERIHERRRALHLSQAKLADLIGSSQRQVSKYELGTNEPTSGVLTRLAEALQTTTDYLVGRSDEIQRPMRTVFDLDDFEVEALRVLRQKSDQDHERILAILKLL